MQLKLSTARLLYSFGLCIGTLLTEWSKRELAGTDETTDSQEVNFSAHDFNIIKTGLLSLVPPTPFPFPEAPEAFTETAPEETDAAAFASWKTRKSVADKAMARWQELKAQNDVQVANDQARRAQIQTIETELDLFATLQNNLEADRQKITAQ